MHGFSVFSSSSSSLSVPFLSVIRQYVCTRHTRNAPMWKNSNQQNAKILWKQTLHLVNDFGFRTELAGVFISIRLKDLVRHFFSFSLSTSLHSLQSTSVMHFTMQLPLSVACKFVIAGERKSNQMKYWSIATIEYTERICNSYRFLMFPFLITKLFASLING